MSRKTISIGLLFENLAERSREDILESDKIIRNCQTEEFDTRRIGDILCDGILRTLMRLTLRIREKSRSWRDGKIQ